ncbi:hypothetical protein N0V90_008579 [Kalmusia sp. IMI 367209]|nr:hypothetical protein N0V90_008579 [Kalmusia sp. IMI 367209]
MAQCTGIQQHGWAVQYRVGDKVARYSDSSSKNLKYSVIIQMGLKRDGKGVRCLVSEAWSKEDLIGKGLTTSAKLAESWPLVAFVPSTYYHILDVEALLHPSHRTWPRKDQGAVDDSMGFNFVTKELEVISNLQNPISAAFRSRIFRFMELPRELKHMVLSNLIGDLVVTTSSLPGTRAHEEYKLSITRDLGSLSSADRSLSKEIRACIPDTGTLEILLNKPFYEANQQRDMQRRVEPCNPEVTCHLKTSPGLDFRNVLLLLHVFIGPDYHEKTPVQEISDLLSDLDAELEVDTGLDIPNGIEMMPKLNHLNILTKVTHVSSQQTSKQQMDADCDAARAALEDVKKLTQLMPVFSRLKAGLTYPGRMFETDEMIPPHNISVEWLNCHPNDEQDFEPSGHQPVARTLEPNQFYASAGGFETLWDQVSKFD